MHLLNPPTKKNVNKKFQIPIMLICLHITKNFCNHKSVPDITVVGRRLFSHTQDNGFQDLIRDDAPDLEELMPLPSPLLQSLDPVRFTLIDPLKYHDNLS